MYLSGETTSRTACGDDAQAHTHRIEVQYVEGFCQCLDNKPLLGGNGGEKMCSCLSSAANFKQALGFLKTLFDFYVFFKTSTGEEFTLYVFCI